jgi:hypothetical protein
LDRDRSPLVKGMLVPLKTSALAPEWRNSQLIITEPAHAAGSVSCTTELFLDSVSGERTWTGADGKKPESTSAATSSNMVDNLPRSRGRPRIMRGR